MTGTMTLQGAGAVAQEEALKQPEKRRTQPLFDRALIAEGLRRTRTLALLMAALTWGAAVLYPIMRFGDARPDLPILCGLIQINPVLLLSFAVYAPFLTLKVFDFLDSRAGSDLFHAFPVRREALAVSFLTAVALWLVLIIGGSEAITVLVCSVMRSIIRLDTTHLWVYLLQLLTGALAVEMSVFLAMSLTGTILTNLVTALGLIFLPRFLIFAGGEMLTTIVPMLSESHLPLFFTNRLNFVTGMVLGIFTGADYSGRGGGPLYFAPAILYTGVLALLYALIGCLLFVKRPSEAAGRPALGEKLQGATRIGIGFLFTIPAAMDVCMAVSGFGYDIHNPEFISTAAIMLGLYLLGFGAMIAYEYLSAHRLLRFRELMRGAVIVLLLDVLWIAAGLLMGHLYAQERIAAEDIASVSLEDSAHAITAMYFAEGNGQTYLGSKLRGVSLNGEEIKQLAALRHDQAAQNIDPYESVRIMEKEGSGSAEQSENFWVTRVQTKFCLQDGRELYRNLYYTKELPVRCK